MTPCGVLGEYIYALKELDFNFVIDPVISIEEIEYQISADILYSAVVIMPTEDEQISFEYIAFQEIRFNREDASLISGILQNIHRTALLSELGILESDIDMINAASITYTIREIEDVSFFDIAIAAPIGLALLLYKSILFFCYIIASSISMEKTSRVIETLVTSTTGTSIVIGKTIGMGIIGLLQLLFLSLLTMLTFEMFVTSNVSFLHNIIGALELSFINIALVVIYFLLGYLLFAFLSAIAGSAAAKPEDLQLTILPITFSLVVIFGAAVFGIIFTETRASEFIALIPLTSPFAMPGRLLFGYASGGDIIVSIFALVMTILFAAFLAIRIYSVAILHYGNRLKFKDLFNIAIKMK